MIRPLLFLATLLITVPAFAQDKPVVSKCMAIAQSVPGITYANFTPGWQPVATEEEAVTITYAGHSTYLIETPAGVRIATDFSGAYGSEFHPRVITMNKAHRTHYTNNPPADVEYVLRGWNPDGGPAHHALVVDDVTIRNVPTDIRHGVSMEPDGNSIFIFEVAGLCIGHLGHLHHRLENAHYGAIGRLDIVMVPIDGGMTLSVEAMSEIATRLYSSMILPMHRHATPLGEFTGLMGDGFAVDYRSSDTLTVSLKSLPDRPTIVVLSGV
ncbi:MAG: MBL fold metallo-hydrolase [Rhizobiaceae bacterium]|nr:MBL fold metallo-hydrolase [Rhizobiaceae bacterium]